MKHWQTLNFLACNIITKLDINDYSFAQLALILLLHDLVKCRSCSLAVGWGQKSRNSWRGCQAAGCI